MELEHLRQALEAFLDAAPGNRIARPEPLSTSPAGEGPLRIYDPPLLAVAGAGDPLWERLRDPEVVGPQLLGPDQWLPGARSVVSFFLPYTRQVRRANRIPGTTATEWLYGRYEGGHLVELMDGFLARLLGTAGWRALAPSLDSRFRITAMRANWSERHAAFVAGLGTFSLSRSLITRAGSAGRIGSVVTDAVLAPTIRPYREPAEYCRNCGACIERCPCGAIGPQGKDNLVCKQYLDRTLALYSPRYGCGKCQTGVPCEGRVPAARAEARA